MQEQIDKERVEAWGKCAAATCEHSQDDGCCGHADAPTPECHEWACCLLVRRDQ